MNIEYFGFGEINEYIGDSDADQEGLWYVVTKKNWLIVKRSMSASRVINT